MQTSLNEIITYIAQANPEHIAAFNASDETKTRLGELIRKEKTLGLSSEETFELEHLMRLAKAKAKTYPK